MTWNSVMGFISTITLFLPILLLLAFRLGTYRSFPFLVVYYSMVFVYNLMTEGFIQANAGLFHGWGLFNNLLDAPVMLLFLTYFSPSTTFTKRLKLFIVSFFLFETTVVLLVGFNVDAITIILGPGLLTVFALCLYLFIRLSKIAVINRKAIGKTLITASLAFAYGSYFILYMLYYVFKTPHIADTFLIYFLVTTFSSLFLCAGIIFERKRIQKLFELKKARKELLDVYKDTTKAIPFRTAMLDFETESWN
jgi:hypothetical protein